MSYPGGRRCGANEAEQHIGSGFRRLADQAQALRREGMRFMDILLLPFERIEVTAVYAENRAGQTHCNTIPFRTFDQFKGDVDVLTLAEPLPPVHEEKVSATKLS